MKNDHADKVWDDAQTAKGPLDKEEKKSADGVSEEKKESGGDEAHSETAAVQTKTKWMKKWVKVRVKIIRIRSTIFKSSELKTRQAYQR